MKSQAQYRGVTSPGYQCTTYHCNPPLSLSPKNSTCISIELRFVVLHSLHSPAYSISPLLPPLSRVVTNISILFSIEPCSLIAVIVVTLINHSSSDVTQWSSNSNGTTTKFCQHFSFLSEKSFKINSDISDLEWGVRWELGANRDDGTEVGTESQFDGIIWQFLTDIIIICVYTSTATPH